MPKQKPARSVSPTIWVSLAAFVVSAASLIVSIQQTQLARQQQNASVWPYLETMFFSSKQQLTLSIKNKGVGPALIKKVSIQYRGKNYTDFQQALPELFPTGTFDYLLGSLSGQVLSAGEETTLLDISTDSASVKSVAKRLDSMRYQVYFESVFGQKWVMAEDTVRALD